MNETPRTDAHVRQLADFLRHPHWIEFARELERENRLLRAKFNVTKDGYESYKSEAIELMKDKERLEWLFTWDALDWIYWKQEFGEWSQWSEPRDDMPLNRDSIDARRKEPKNEQRQGLQAQKQPQRSL